MPCGTLGPGMGQDPLVLLCCLSPTLFQEYMSLSWGIFFSFSLWKLPFISLALLNSLGEKDVPLLLHCGSSSHGACTWVATHASSLLFPSLCLHFPMMVEVRYCGIMRVGRGRILLNFPLSQQALLQTMFQLYFKSNNHETLT